MDKVLIVEDQKIIREMLKRLLINVLDYIDTNEENIFEAENGLDMVAIVKNNPDLKYIFLDTDMPLMDGNEALASLIRQNYIHDTKKIVFIADSVPDADLLSSKHVLGVIRKPIDTEKIYQSLKNMLFTEYELLSEDEKIELENKINKQRQTIIDIVLKSTSREEETEHINQDDFIEELNSYYEDNELLPQNDVVPIAQEFIKKIFKQYNVQSKVNRQQLENVFQNQEKVETKNEDTKIEDKQKLIDYLETKSSEKDRKEINEEIIKEIKRYENIIKKYESKIKPNKKLSKFVKIFDDNDLMLLHTFLVKVVFEFVVHFDFSVETNNIKVLIKDINLFLRASKIMKNIEEEKLVCKVTNKYYEEFKDKYKKSFDITHRYLYYMLIAQITSEMRKSDPVLTRLTDGDINRITLNSLLYFFTYKENYRKVKALEEEFSGLKVPDFRRLKTKMAKVKLNIIYLSYDLVEENDCIKTMQGVIKKGFDSYNFYPFAKNNVFDAWTNTHKRVDIIFLEDAYEQKQEYSFFQFLKKHKEIFSKVKIVLISTGKKVDNNQKLVQMSHKVFQKPLDSKKIHKYLLSL